MDKIVINYDVLCEGMECVGPWDGVPAILDALDEEDVEDDEVLDSNEEDEAESKINEITSLRDRQRVKLWWSFALRALCSTDFDFVALSCQNKLLNEPENLLESIRIWYHVIIDYKYIIADGIM